MNLPSRLVRTFTEVKLIPSATTSKNFAVTYMDFYFCLRRRGPEAMLLSRIYDRTVAYMSVRSFKGPKDPKNPTPAEMEKMSILESMPRDGSASHGWVQFKDTYWMAHLPLTSDQISRALLFLCDIGIIELETSRGTERAIKGIRLVRINADVYNRAVFECVETATAQRTTWGEGRGKYEKKKEDFKFYDFWTWIKSERRVEIIPTQALPAGLEPFPKHIPRKRKPCKPNHDTANHGICTPQITVSVDSQICDTANHGSHSAHDTANHGICTPQITVSVDSQICDTANHGSDDRTQNTERGQKTPLPQITVPYTANHGICTPQITVYEHRKSRYMNTANHGDKEQSEEQILKEQSEEQERGYAVFQPRNFELSSNHSHCSEVMPATETSVQRNFGHLGKGSRKYMSEEIKASGALELMELIHPWSEMYGIGGYNIEEGAYPAAMLGWKYVVRHERFWTYVMDKGTPLDTVPWAGVHDPESMYQLSDRIHALVQAMIDYYDGDDPWLHVTGGRDCMDMPGYGVPKFNRLYKSRLREITAKISELEACRDNTP